MENEKYDYISMGQETPFQEKDLSILIMLFLCLIIISQFSDNLSKSEMNHSMRIMKQIADVKKMTSDIVNKENIIDFKKLISKDELFNYKIIAESKNYKKCFLVVAIGNTELNKNQVISLVYPSKKEVTLCNPKKIVITGHKTVLQNAVIDNELWKGNFYFGEYNPKHSILYNSFYYLILAIFLFYCLYLLRGQIPGQRYTLIILFPMTILFFGGILLLIKLLIYLVSLIF